MLKATTSKTFNFLGIKKTYRNTFGAPVMKAVHGLYAGVAKGECFGLLGVNGAGES